MKSLQPSKKNIQFIKKLKLFSMVIFALLDPDQDCESGYGSRDPIESGSNPDPDPQHWLYMKEILQFRYGNSLCRTL
jgi:hypothetical protein